MQNLLLKSLVIVAGVLVTTSTSQAAGPGKARLRSPRASKSPTISPYLDIVGASADPAFQYYRRVLPERVTRSNARQLEQSIQQANMGRPRMNQAQAGVPADADSAVVDSGVQAVPQTGHAVSFLGPNKFFSGLAR